MSVRVLDPLKAAAKAMLKRAVSATPVREATPALLVATAERESQRTRSRKGPILLSPSAWPEPNARRRN